MRKLRKHTFNMLTSDELEDIMRLKYVVRYDARKGYPGISVTEGDVWTYEYQLLEGEVDFKSVKKFLKDPTRPFPTPLDVIAYLIDKKVIPKGDYILEFL